MVLSHLAPSGAVPVDAYFWFAQDFLGLAGNSTGMGEGNGLESWEKLQIR